MPRPGLPPNIVLAGACLLFVKVVTLSMDPIVISVHGVVYPLFWMCQMDLFLNVILAVFNLCPVPPLDGSWILARGVAIQSRGHDGQNPPCSFILSIALLMSDFFGMILSPVLSFVGELAL